VRGEALPDDDEAGADDGLPLAPVMPLQRTKEPIR
jgi:hypothetical protein